jgi:hypothetical protein
MQIVKGCAGSPAQSLTHRRRADRYQDIITYVGLDVHKATVRVALAEGSQGGEVRPIGVFENRPELLLKLAARPGGVG